MNSGKFSSVSVIATNIYIEKDHRNSQTWQKYTAKMYTLPWIILFEQIRLKRSNWNHVTSTKTLCVIVCRLIYFSVNFLYLYIIFKTYIQQQCYNSDTPFTMHHLALYTKNPKYFKWRKLSENKIKWVRLTASFSRLNSMIWRMLLISCLVSLGRRASSPNAFCHSVFSNSAQSQKHSIIN